jgi:hypothetical protein
LSINSIYHRRLADLAKRLGSLPEQQLLARWQADLDGFLRPADRELVAGGIGLEFGIEDTLALKINLKARGLGAVTTMLALLRQSPDLLPWGELILRDQLRFHCGLKLTPDRLSRELYIYPRDHAAVAPLLGDTTFNSAVQELKPLFIGVDDHRGLSMYFPATGDAWVGTLRQELGLADWGGATLWPWQQVRFDGQQLIRGKTAVELKPLTAPVLARFISHYPFPWFRYLIGLRDLRDGNFGRDPVTGRFALYGTVN